METIWELAETLGTAVDEGDFNTYDVYQADEAFVSGTRDCLLPVISINSVSLGASVPGPAARKLLAAWSDRVGLDFMRQAIEHLPAAG